nr:MAG TPA: hypothetical protein [Caudoviricetes sp.]
MKTSEREGEETPMNDAELRVRDGVGGWAR